MDIAALQKALGVKFLDPMLLLSAMTHRSYLNENRRHPAPHNERLEFLGDAVIEMIVTEHIYFNYHANEGVMTNVRTMVVNYKYLSSVVSNLGIEKFILMSRGEAKDNGKARVVILANCMEAIIGAMYLDSGFDVCKDFISRNMLMALPKIVTDLESYDPKSQLQEIVQSRLHVTPTYRVMSESGPDHAKQFVVAAFAGPQELGRGNGQSKKDAEIESARDALRRIAEKNS